MTRRRWRPIGHSLVAALGVLAISSCASTGSPPGDPAAPTSTSRVSPLDDFLRPAGDAALPTSDEEYQAKERQVQDLIAACMKEQGFEYIPFVYPISGPGMGTDVELDQRAWIEKYGYGMSTLDGRNPDGTEPVDPNNAILETMGQAEADAYMRAMNGEQFAMDMEQQRAAADPSTTDAEPTGPETTGPDTAGTAATEPSDTQTESPPASTDAEAAPALQDQGCWGRSQAEVYGDGFFGGGDQFQDLWEAMSRLWETTQQDDRLKQVTADWAGCLSDAGHPGFTVPQDPADDVMRRWSELNGWPAPDAEMTGPLELTGEPTTPAPDDVSKFRSDEITLALADYDCRAKVGYEAAFDTVRIEAETQFVEEHRAELEQYRDEMNGGGG